METASAAPLVTSVLLFALAAPALAFAHVADAHAQSSPTTTPFQPSLTDPRNTQALQRAADQDARGDRARGRRRPSPPARAKPASTPPARSRRRRRTSASPATPRPPPPPPPKPPGPPQAAGGHTHRAADPRARSPTADAYKPPDALPRRQLVPIGDPFEPLGIRAGTFLLKPSIEVTRGYDTNPERTSTGTALGLHRRRAGAEGRARSGRRTRRAQTFAAPIRGSTRQPSLNRPMLDAKAFARFDVSRDTAFNVEGRYFLSTDYPGSPNVPADVAKLPIFHTYGTHARPDAALQPLRDRRQGHRRPHRISGLRAHRRHHLEQPRPRPQRLWRHAARQLRGVSRRQAVRRGRRRHPQARSAIRPQRL